MSTLRIPVGPDDHAQGPADAPVTLVEYADYQCPYCAQAFPIVRQLQARFGHDLRLVFRNFPLSQAHPQALPAALVAEFAGQHRKFWPAHDALFENQDRLGGSLYAELLETLGLGADALESALQSRPLLERVQADLDGGLRSGVNGTPAFFLNGQRYDVRNGFDELAAPIEALIAQSRA